MEWLEIMTKSIATMYCVSEAILVSFISNPKLNPQIIDSKRKRNTL